MRKSRIFIYRISKVPNAIDSAINSLKMLEGRNAFAVPTPRREVLKTVLEGSVTSDPSKQMN
jgi:hypothetical protein